MRTLHRLCVCVRCFCFGAGTIFLFIMWPSFNGVLCSDSGRMRAITNTFLSLCGSVIVTFIVSIVTRYAACPCVFGRGREI